MAWKNSYNGLVCALFILLLTPFSFADYVDECVVEMTAYMPLIGLAVSITLILIAIAYMFSQLLQSVPLAVWAKDELVQLGISILLILGVVGAFHMGCVISFAYAGGNPFGIASSYLDGLAAEGLNIITSLLYESYNKQLESTFGVFLGVPIGGGWGISPYVNKRVWAQQKSLAADMLMPFVISIKIQRIALYIIRVVGFSIVLPLAIILRVFPFTRDMGNLLIALSFGLYVIFPLTYALNAKVAADITEDPIHDKMVNFSKMGKIIPQAVLFPNISLVIVVTFVQALNKALRSITA